MPLDGHSLLVSQGWSGKGTGLRQGAITRPIVVTQKKTLSGLGKDRDEAFPFWDHLFSAASKAIKVKIDDSDTDENTTTSPPPALKRTTTGILSNRRPVDVPSASTSGSVTPDPSNSNAPRLSLIALAKREAAKRHLYSKFYRGLIMAPDAELPSKPVEDPVEDLEPIQAVTIASVDMFKSECELVTDVKRTGKRKEKSTRKRSHREEEQAESDEERQERKRRRKEEKEKEKVDKKARRKAKREAMETAASSEKKTSASLKMDKEERRRRKREKKSQRSETSSLLLKEVADGAGLSYTEEGLSYRAGEPPMDGKRRKVEESVTLPKVKKKRKAEA